MRATLALALLLLAGCTQWRWDLGSPLYTLPLPDPDEQVSLGQVLDILGPPQRLSASPAGYTLAWEHWHIREDSLGFSLGFMGVDALSADWGSMRAKGEFLLLTFDREYLLTSATRSSWDSDAGGGRAIQPFMSFVSVVDAGDLAVRMPQHRWGAESLESLPRTLNSDSNLDTGQNGLQQRGTPASIGQHSLEFD